MFYSNPKKGFNIITFMYIRVFITQRIHKIPQTLTRNEILGEIIPKPATNG